MKHALFKDLIREIRGSFGRFMAIFAIVLIGVAFYAGVSATPANMRYTADHYFDGNRLQDLRLISSIGFNGGDIDMIRKDPGVRGVYAARIVDVLARKEGEDSESVFSLMSFDRDTSDDNEDYMNRFRIQEGRLPEKPDECAVRVPMARKQQIFVGDRIRIRSGDEYDISEVMASDTLTVVGIVWTPYSISFDLGTSSVGNGSVDMLAFVPDHAFLTDYYTNVYVTVRGAEQTDTFTGTYFDTVRPVADRLKMLGEDRIRIRTAELQNEIYEAVEEEVTAQVTASVATQVEQAVSEEIADRVEEEVEQAVAAGIEDEVRARLEQEVRAGIEQMTRDQVGEAVRAGLESTVRQRVEDAVRTGIRDTVYAAVEAEARRSIADAVYSEVENAVQAGLQEEVLNRVTEEVKARIAEEVRQAVTEQVKAQIAENVRAEVTARVKEEIASQVRSDLTARVTADVEQQILMQLLTDDMKEQAILTGVELLFPAAYALAEYTYLDTYVNEAYPAAYAAAEAEYLDAYVNEAYPAAYTAAEAAYLETYVNEAMPAAMEAAMAGEEYQQALDAAYQPALEQALDENLQAAVDEAFPGALETAMAENFQAAVDTQYPAALEQAMQGFDALVDEQYQAVIGGVINENLNKTVDEKLPDVLQEAMDENLEKAVEEKYPEALQEAMDAHFRESADELILEETGKILPDKINEVYEEQLRETLEGSEDWQWYILNRNYQPSYVEYRSISEQMDQIAILFPLFFFFVAALVCFTTMTRMVDEQRVLIGTYKALGYSSFSIALRYILYALTASLLGGAAGSVIGILTFPAVIFNAWGIAYQMPQMMQAEHLPLMIISVLSITGVVVFAAIMACARELRAKPAELMRPKAPKIGKTVFLERIGFIWKRLSFTGKVTVRNIFRYKKRFFMTLAGVAGCTALLITGFGISDSIRAVVQTQFDEIFRYHTSMTVKAGTDPVIREELKDALEDLEDFSDTAFVYTASALANLSEKKNEGRDDLEISITIPEKNNSFDRFVLMRDPDTKEVFSIKNEGCFVAKRAADELGLSAGDSFYIETNEGVRREVKIAGLLEMYVGYPVFMNMDYYSSVFGSRPEYNAMYAKNAEGTDEAALGKMLMEMEGVSGAAFTSKNIATINSMIDALGMITVVLIISSALLSFVVLYNLSNVNISERLREIATIKVLGFYDNEVNAYISRETVAITVLGALAGLGLGVVLHHTIMKMIAMKTVTFGNTIEIPTYIYAFLLTIIFSLAVSIFINRKLRNIPMVESLKSVE